MGSRLATILSQALGQGQVFDLADNRPGEVLSKLWANLKEREAVGNERAAHIRK